MGILLKTDNPTHKRVLKHIFEVVLSCMITVPMHTASLTFSGKLSFKKKEKKKRQIKKTNHHLLFVSVFVYVYDVLSTVFG